MRYLSHYTRTELNIARMTNFVLPRIVGHNSLGMALACLNRYRTVLSSSDRIACLSTIWNISSCSICVIMLCLFWDCLRLCYTNQFFLIYVIHTQFRLWTTTNYIWFGKRRRINKQINKILKVNIYHEVLFKIGEGEGQKWWKPVDWI